MASLDIGIDLGTCNIYAMDSTRKTILREPAVVAIDKRSGKVMGVGQEVHDMVGKTPGYIDVIRPLSDGVISNYEMTELLIRHMLKKVTGSQLLKPRVCLCVPSAITNVESQAVVDATVASGARKVFLIEEPVAAAIGAGMDLSIPNGNMIVDIGGGTTDIAVLSLNGVVCKASVKVAGHAFDDVLIKHMRRKYNLLIGEPTAERVKIEIGSVYPRDCQATTEVKGRDIVSGLPRKVTLNRSETMHALKEPMDQILSAIVGVFERTPPELASDIRANGIVLTGGGVLLDGLPQAIEQRTGVIARVADDPEHCVAIGTAMSFDYFDKLYDGFVSTSTHAH